VKGACSARCQDPFSVYLFVIDLDQAEVASNAFEYE
jgi:hypothetical protein